MNGREMSAALVDHLTSVGRNQKYSGQDWLAAMEVTLPNRDGGRVDVLAARKSFSSFEIRAHEVKVSRSDFLSDVNSGKYRRYLAACHTVVFTVPKGLVKAAEVPADAGLLVHDADKGTWRMARRPPSHARVNPPQLDLPVLLALAMAVDGRHEGEMLEMKRAGRERDLARSRMLGRRAAREKYAGIPMAVLDEEAALDWAMSRAGHVLRKRVGAADGQARQFDRLVKALREAGVPSRGSWSLSEGEAVIEAAAKAVERALAITKHADALANLADGLSGHLRGRKVWLDPAKAIAAAAESAPA